MEAPKESESPKNPTPSKPLEPKPVEKPKLLDINTATFTQLRGIGLSNNIVLAVINKRPFKRVEDMKNVPGMNAQKYNIIEKKICCVPLPEDKEPPKIVVLEEEPKEEPVEVKVVPESEEVVEKVTVSEQPKKVNVNTASAQEIHDFTGLSMNACWAITGKRKVVGRFTSLDELVIPKRLSAKMLETCRDKMEV
jgi:DNA uptake protein ComE-like DNA-binding protein